MSSSVNNRRSGNTNSDENARLQIELESLDLNLQSYIYSKVVLFPKIKRKNGILD